MGPIILSAQEHASNSDILQGTRLQTVPAGGVLTLRFSRQLVTRATITQRPFRCRTVIRH